MKQGRTRVDLKKIKDGSGLNAEQTLDLAENGELNREAIAMVALLRHAMMLEGIAKAGGFKKSQLKWVKHHQQIWPAFKAKFAAACQQGDGSFLRDMADAIEKGSAVHPAAATVGKQLLSKQAFNLPLPTVPEMVKMLTGSNRMTVSRYYKLFDVQPIKGKPGAPKGKRSVKTKSPLRARK